MRDPSDLGGCARRTFLAAASMIGLAALARGGSAAATPIASSGDSTKRLSRYRKPAIAYDDLGVGDSALLFTPGWCVSRNVFASLPARCAAQRRVLALDWRGHGESGAAEGDFGDPELVEDAIDVIRASGVERVVPVALAHSGWVALELRRRLGAVVDKIVLVDWLVLEPPPQFAAALQDLQRPDRWQAARDRLFATWTQDIGHPDLESFIPRDMGKFDFAMWARAGREIGREYSRWGSPLGALATMQASFPVLHLYAQPDDAGYLDAQTRYSDAHPWYRVHKLGARSHFPMFEVPAEMAEVIGAFAA